MAIQRSSIKTGPAIVKYNGAVIYFKDGIEIAETVETFDIAVDNYGPKTDQRVKYRHATISGKPAGEWRDLAILWPWLNASVGVRVHGDEDKELVIHAKDGTLYTYHNAAITKMPNLKFAATATLLDQIEFTCRIKDNTEPTAANAPRLLAAINTPPEPPAEPEPGLIGKVGEKGVKPLMEIITKVNRGELDRDTAVNNVMAVYGLPFADADTLMPLAMTEPAGEE